MKGKKRGRGMSVELVMEVITGEGRCGRAEALYAALELEFHIEPKNPRADCTISAARLTSVLACSCMPSNDTRCTHVGCLNGDLTGESGDMGLAGVESSEVVADDPVVARDVDGDGSGSCDAETGDDTGSAFCAGGTPIRKEATGELDGVGCRDRRCSSSSTSGMGDGSDGETAAFADAWKDSRGLSGSAETSRACWASLGPTVDTLAVSVDEPETEDSGDGTCCPCLSKTASVSSGEYSWYMPSLLLPLDGELTRLGGLTLSPSRRPVLSLPRSSSLSLLRPLRSASLPRFLDPA